MTRLLPPFACVVTVVLLAVAGGAQQEPGQGPTFRTGISLVRVDVVATDKSGELVPNLTAGDFEILEDGKRQTIETFRLLALDSGANREVAINNSAFDDEEAARDDVRVFGIFLDDYHVSREGGRTAADQLAQFIERELAPSDMIGIMHPHMLLTDVRINRDHDGAARSVREFEGRRGNTRPVNVAEENALLRYPRDIPKIRREVSLSALRSFILRLGGLKDGRKTLVLVTEGYGSPGGGGGGRGRRGLDMSAGAGDTVGVFNDLRSVAELASRYNTALYTVNPQVLVPRAQWEASPASDTLKFLAENTGGRAIFDHTRNYAEFEQRRGTPSVRGFARPRSNIAPALKQILVDASANYLLGYRSPVMTPDDKLHKIEVRTKKRDVELRYRKGWWSFTPPPAPPPDDTPPVVTPKAMQVALTTALTPRDRIVRTWLGQSRGDDGKTRLTFIWEPVTKPGEVRDADRPAAIVVTATDPEGSTIFTDRAGLPSDDIARAPRMVFDLAPSTVRLRLRVENDAAEVLDSETRPVTVLDLRTPELILGTPEVFRVRTMLDVQRVRADPNPTPSPTREFSRSERLLVRVPVYGSAAVGSSLAAQLLNRTGRLITDLPVSRVDGSGPQLELSLNSLPPDDYVLRLVAAVAQASAEELVAFRVVN
jgi:VWFA-related protein